MTRAVLLALSAVACLALAGPVGAQSFSGAFEGMAQSDQPIQIEADQLEVADGAGEATFSGNVQVTQGTTTLKTAKLRVLYSRDSAGRAGPGGNVSLIEASGKVAVRSGDQVATADTASVDMIGQVATLSGDVAVSQGTNIITGCSVRVDLRTNNIDVKPCKQSGGRVKVLIDRLPKEQ